MKRVLAYLVLLILVLDCLHAGEPEKYMPSSRRKQRKYATAEPGTYLKPSAGFVLKRMNRAMQDSTAKMPAPWLVRLFTPGVKDARDTVITFDGCRVPVRIYYPSRESMEGNQALTIFYHGGGFVLGSVEQYHAMVSKLARVTGQIMVSVEYRLAPEHPYPAAVDDCYAVLQWMQHYGCRIGADTTRISVMGDSAGGNLATVMTLKCLDQLRPQPFRQVLLYPAVTFRDTEYPSMTYFLRDPQRQYVLNEEFLRRVRKDYRGNNADDLDRYISPLEAELSGELAPALIIAAECDPLRDSNRAYALKLQSAAVEVQYMEYSGMIHAFASFPMVISDALDAMREIRDYLCEN